MDARNSKLARDKAESKKAKVKDVNELRGKQKEEISKLKSGQKNSINEAKKVKEEEKCVALTALKKRVSNV